MSVRISELRETFNSGRTRSLAWRKSQLDALLALLRDNEDKISTALYQDLGKHPAEAYRDETGVVEKAVKHTLSSLDKWVSPRKGQIPLVFFPAKGEVLPEPLGVVLILSSWNFPISLSLDPLVGAISAGNAAVIKPSELAPACSSFLADTIPLYLDNRAIKVIEGGVDVCTGLLQHKWDKIFFTGSPRVGRIVMSAAAHHLTPVTLELGGKCPVILDRLSSPNLKVAVTRIAAGKWGSCCGQACIAVDYLLVEHKYASTVIELLKKTIRQFYGENPKFSKNISRIVNENHFERLRSLLQDPAVSASIVHGGFLDDQELFLEPTILLDPPLDSEVMTEEIFGPLLPIVTLNDIDESVGFINSRPKPLAIYAFTESETLKKKILLETSSGSVTFNDVMIQFVCESLPFGGVGQSGMGRYHGKYSFDTFSHEKAVLHMGFLTELKARYPPWNDYKLLFIKLVYRLDYFGLLLLLLGLKKATK